MSTPRIPSTTSSSVSKRSRKDVAALLEASEDFAAPDAVNAEDDASVPSADRSLFSCAFSSSRCFWSSTSSGKSLRNVAFVQFVSSDAAANLRFCPSHRGAHASGTTSQSIGVHEAGIVSTMHIRTCASVVVMLPSVGWFSSCSVQAHIHRVSEPESTHMRH